MSLLNCKTLHSFIHSFISITSSSSTPKALNPPSISPSMKLTCLSEGGGFYAPPSQVLQLCGFTLLFDCPLDLSALAVFAPPIPGTSSSSSSDANGTLIRAVPWYKTVASLHLWDPDAVLVSSPMGMLGLPFLTRNPGFSASTKIYATDPTVRLGRLMMEELVSMHAEYVRCYGPDKKSWPDWMNWTELDGLQPECRRVLGEEREELSGWMPLYSAGDIKNCIDRIQPLRLGEEACFNDALVIKALSSGLEIGSCNWSIKSPKGSFVYLSSSVFEPVHAMEFDYRSLTGHDAVIYSDFSSLTCMDSDEENANRHALSLSEEGVDQSLEELTASDEFEEEADKMRFICSCIVNSVKEGGSVLIPSGRCGVILSLLENICDFLGSLKMKVPIYIISEAAQETLALTNSVPEWLCKKRQEKLFSGEKLFRHVELIKEGIVTTYPFLYCSDLLENWKEPCIVISPHWSLRLGSAVQLLCRWHSDPRSLLILEEGMPAELALMPFKPVKIKVLQCSFLSGIQTKKVNSLFRMLQPKLVLLPESLSSQCATKENELYKIIYYFRNEITRIPNLKDELEAYLATDLAFQLQPRKYSEKSMAAARLKGKLVLRKGVYFLALPGEPLNMSGKPLLHWGNVDPNSLMQVLNEKEISGSIVRNENCDFCVCVKKPEEALIEVKSNNIMISCKDETISALVYEALKSVCNGI